MKNNLKDAFISVINKKKEAKSDYEIRKQEHLKQRKALADNVVRRISFLIEYGFEVYSQMYYEDCIPFNHSYEVVIKKPNGSLGGIIYPCDGEYVASSYQIFPEDGYFGNPSPYFYKTWEDLAKAIAWTLC